MCEWPKESKISSIRHGCLDRSSFSQHDEHMTRHITHAVHVTAQKGSMNQTSIGRLRRSNLGDRSRTFRYHIGIYHDCELISTLMWSSDIRSKETLRTARRRSHESSEDQHDLNSCWSSTSKCSVHPGDGRCGRRCNDEVTDDTHKLALLLR